MKKNSSSKYQNIINQILTLFFSGAYITSKDMIDIADNLEISLPSKSRELILKNLFNEADHAGKIEELYQQLIELFQKRVKSYKELTQEFPHINSVSNIWIQKSMNIIKLLHQQKRGNIYA